MTEGTKVRTHDVRDSPGLSGMVGFVERTDAEGAVVTLQDGFCFYFFFDELEEIA